jgi:WD40 repeat protein
MEQRFTAFISYRHLSPDQEVAKWLHTAIETYHIPASIRKQTGIKKMGKCFRDAEELPLSPSLGDDIERALLASDWLIAVCTPRYLESRWCLRELEFFAQHKGRERILVVLADGHPAESLPELLRWRIDENGNTVPYEPLAAEARGATMAERVKKLRVEKYRLLAPMLGVGFDDLRRRARQRRIRIVAGVCAAVVVAGAALGVYIAANRAKQERLRLEAEEQQRIAMEQQRIAEEERLRAAENSIGEYLERAATRLAEGERLAAVDTLLDAVAFSEENGDLRHDEIIAALQKAAYVMPFEPVAEFSNQNVRLLDVDAAPDGRLAAGVENSDTVAVIDLMNNAIRYKVTSDNYQIDNIKFSPDGTRFLAMCDMGRYVTVWNVADGSVAFTYTSKADARYQIANVFFWDGPDTIMVQDMDRFYLVSADGTEKLFYTLGAYRDGYDYDENIMTIVSGRSLGELITLHNDDYSGMTAVCTPDRSRILIGNRAGETGMVLLDREGRFVTELSGMPGTFAEKYAVSNDGKTVACLSLFGFYAGWDGETGELIYFDFLDGQGANLSDPVFSPDGQYLTYVVNDMFVIADARTGETLLNAYMDDNNIVPTVSYSDDGEYIFIVNQSLYITDKEGTIYTYMPGDFAAPFNDAVQLGDKVLLIKNDGTAWICCTPAASSIRSVGPEDVPALCPDYDPHVLPEGNPFVSLMGRHELTQAFRDSTALADLAPKLWYAQDGSRVALSYPDGVIEVFEDAASGAVSLTISQITREITALSLTGKWLIASGGDGRLMFYDLEKREVVKILNTELPSAGFALDAREKLLMSARTLSDGIGEITVYDVYDLETASLLFTMRATEPVSDFGFAADGSCALCLTDSGALRAELWTDESALLAYAKALCTR